MTALITRNTAAWRLFNLRYIVLLPVAAQYSKEYLANNSFESTGDVKLDRLRLDLFDQTRVTVAALAMFVSEGYDFDMLNYQDCVQIFHDIQTHLNDWLLQTRTYIRVEDIPPIEDFRAFESIAITIYAHALRLEPKATVASEIFNNLVSMNRSRNLTATNKWLNERNKTKGELNPYVSVVDQLERFVVENTHVNR